MEAHSRRIVHHVSPVARRHSLVMVAVVAMAIVLVLVGKPLASVKVQRGTALIPEGQGAIPITLAEAVDTTRTVLLYSVSSTSSIPQQYTVAGTFSGSNSLYFSRSGSGKPVELHWQVLEFSDGVRVQRGSTLLNEATKEIQIQPVDTRRSFAVTYLSTYSSSHARGGGVLSELNSDGSRLRLASGGNGDLISWQVVEYSGARTQHFRSTMEMGVKEKSLPLGNGVNPDNSMLLGTQMFQQAPRPSEFPLVELANANYLSLRRDGASKAIHFSIWLIEFQDGTRVQSRVQSFDALQKQVEIPLETPPVLERSAVVSTGNFGFQAAADETPGGILNRLLGDSVAIGTVWHTLQLEKTGLTIRRSSAGVATRQRLQVVLFSSAPQIQTHPQGVKAATGQSALFKIEASPSGLEYQWFEANPLKSLAGADKPIFTLPDVGLKDNGREFFCRVTNGTDTVDSQKARLTVENDELSSPQVSPQGGSFPGEVEVTLSSPGTEIYYTLDGSAPLPARSHKYSQPIEIGKATVLQALAYKDGATSTILTERYSILFGAGNYTRDTLRAGDELQIATGARIKYPEDLLSPPLLLESRNLSEIGKSGFAEATPMVRFTRLSSSLPFPKVYLLTDQDSERSQSLFEFDAREKIVWLGMPSDSFPVQREGTFFLARDIQAPTVELVADTVVLGEITRLSLRIEDNVDLLPFEIEANYLPRGRDGTGEFDSPDQEFLFEKAEASEKAGFVPIRFRVEMSDGTHKAFFPSEPGRFYQPTQHLGDQSLQVHHDVSRIWNLLGFPILSDQPLDVADLKGGNDGASYKAYRYQRRFGSGDSVTGEYESITQGVLRPTESLWLKYSKPLDEIRFSRARTIPTDTRGYHSILLRRGWNQIASPSLQPLPWPYPHRDPNNLALSDVKGLHWWDPKLDDTFDNWVEMDTLHPWQGYFVYSHADSVIVTLREELPRGLGKQALSRDDHVHIQVRSGNIRLSMGALPKARSGFGIEDEFSPPSPAGPPSVYLSRDKHRLVADYLPMQGRLPMQWKLVKKSSNERNQLEWLETVSQSLPEGWEAWAVSPTRRYRYRLDESARMPVGSPSGYDTLLILAGPPSSLQKHSSFTQAQAEAPAWQEHWSFTSTGSRFHFLLPEPARVRLVVLDAKGRLRAQWGNRLYSEGSHSFPTLAEVPGERLFMRLEVQGKKLNIRKNIPLPLSTFR